MANEPVPACPNLDSLTRGGPSCKRALVRLYWPKVRASLDLGHTAKSIHEKLQLDGFQISYPSLCRYISELRQAELGNGIRSTACPVREDHRRMESVIPASHDPLRNIRRLTEEKAPGFRYSGTMSEKELFGE
jgi:hypothetical protein